MQSEAQEIAAALNDEGFASETLTDREVTEAINAFGYDCTVAEVRSALRDLDPNQFRR